jgi:hypothetical protein
MALSILDGNQSATTLSTILSSGQHITAHTVVSLGTQAITDIVNATSAGLTNTQLRASAVTIGGTVTVNSSANFDVRVTQGGDPVDGNNAFPVYGTVTANVFGKESFENTFVPIQIGASGENFGNGNRVGVALINDSGTELAPLSNIELRATAVTISGTVTIGSALPAGTNRIGVVTIGAGTVTIGAGTAQIGSVTASISNSVTIASLPAISGTVTANVPFFNFGEGVSDGAGNLPIYGIQIGYADSISGEFQLVADNKPLPISGIVTANSSNGSLTTRFGSVTTANTAFATSAVTNSNRKYLLIQNITTAANVITVGIGFTPTTTQGIQLFAGAGLTFEGSYIPTGAVNLLSSVTASCYTILEA